MSAEAKLWGGFMVGCVAVYFFGDATGGYEIGACMGGMVIGAGMVVTGIIDVIIGN